MPATGGARRRTPDLAARNSQPRSLVLRKAGLVPDTAEGGDGYRRPIAAEIFHRPAAETGRTAGQAPARTQKKAWARSGAWPPRAQTERARSLGPFADDHAVRFLSNARTEL
jgi:hypothetical protein